MIQVDDVLSVKNNFARYQNVKSLLIKGDENKAVKVSICIPTYNRVDTLKETIDSCLNQVNFDDFIIIVSDNNPERNDATEQYILNLDSEKVLYYKHEQNIGMYGNLNRLYQLSKSEYTVCVHDDDLLHPNFLEVCYEIMHKNLRIDILYPLKKQWYEVIEDKPHLDRKISCKLYKLGYLDFFNQNPAPPTGMMVRTCSMLKIGGYEYDTFPSNDYYFNVKAVSYLNVYMIDYPLYIYRWANNTSLKKQTFEGFMTVDPPLTRWISSKLPFGKILYKFAIKEYSCRWINFYKKYYQLDKIGQIDSDIDRYVGSKLPIFYKIILRLYREFYFAKRRVTQRSIRFE